MIPIVQLLAKQISDKLIQLNIINPEEKSISIYGFEIFISSILGILCVALISIVAGHPFLWLPYLLGFAPLRMFGGGYHAKTHFGCIFSFSFVYSTVLLAIEQIKNHRMGASILSVASAIIVVLLAPVEASNKPLSSRNRIRNRNKSLLLSGFNLLICILLTWLDFRATQYSAYIMGTFIASLSMVAAKSLNQ